MRTVAAGGGGAGREEGEGGERSEHRRSDEDDRKQHEPTHAREDTGPGSARDLVVGGDRLGGLGAAQDFAGLGHALTTDPTGAGVGLPAGAGLPATVEETELRWLCVDFQWVHTRRANTLRFPGTGGFPRLVRRD